MYSKRLWTDLASTVLQAEAATFHFDDLSRLQEAIQNRRRGRHVTDQFAPILERSVRRHQCALEFMAAHDDLEKIFARALRKLLHPHVIEDQKIGLQITSHRFLVTVKSFIVQQVADGVEDAAIEHRHSGTNQLTLDGHRLYRNYCRR